MNQVVKMLKIVVKNAEIWVHNNYMECNWFPGFFKEDGYTYTMKEIVEDSSLNHKLYFHVR
jgi:hypothetical protein